ncbi:MAG: hypothetical protein RMK18_11565 [Armatimonadota bacterium]|nr:hypothetical protein [Armatimonadota bacterium]MDW8026483.1 hypothetical protein [Armatimonadota bacterium]
MKTRIVVLTFALAVLFSCAALIVLGCARLKRVSQNELIAVTPPTSIAPPIATIAPPVSVVETPPVEATKVPKKEITEPVAPDVEVAPQPELEREFKKLHTLLSELQSAISTPSPDRVEAASLRVLVRLAHIEVKALEHLRRTEDMVRVSEVIQLMDDVRASLRDARSAVKRGSIKVASAAVDEMIDKVEALEGLLVSVTESKESIPHTEVKQPSEKPSPEKRVQPR